MHAPLHLDEQRLRALWATDATTGEIARALGCSDSLVSKRAIQLGLPRRAISTVKDSSSHRWALVSKRSTAPIRQTSATPHGASRGRRSARLPSHPLAPRPPDPPEPVRCSGSSAGETGGAGIGGAVATADDPTSTVAAVSGTAFETRASCPGPRGSPAS